MLQKLYVLVVLNSSDRILFQTNDNLIGSRFCYGKRISDDIIPQLCTFCKNNCGRLRQIILDDSREVTQIRIGYFMVDPNIVIVPDLYIAFTVCMISCLDVNFRQNILISPSFFTVNVGRDSNRNRVLACVECFKIMAEMAAILPRGLPQMKETHMVCNLE